MTTATIYSLISELLGDPGKARYTGTIIYAYLIQAIGELLEAGQFTPEDVRGIFKETHAVGIPAPSSKPEIDLDTSTIIGSGDKVYRVYRIYYDQLWDTAGKAYEYSRKDFMEWDSRYNYTKPTTMSIYWDVVGHILKFWSATAIPSPTDAYFTIQYLTQPSFPASTDLSSLVETYYSIPFIMKAVTRTVQLIRSAIPEE